MSFFRENHPFYPFFVVTNVIFTTFLTVCCAFTSVIANASIQGELALSNTSTIWVTTLYLLGVNTTVPTATWFGKHVGYKRMYCYGGLIFSLGTFGVAFADQFWLLALFRFIEGVGAGFIFPIGLGLIVQSLPSQKIPLALNLYIAGAFGVGLGAGIPLSGYLTQFFSWRVLFYIMAPLGLLGAFFTWLSKPKSPVLEKTPFDFSGFFFFAAFIASLLIALTFGPIRATAEGWFSPFIISLFILAALCLVIALAIEKNHKDPLIPIQLFKDPIFSTSCAAMFLLGMSLFASVSVSIEYMLNALFYEKYVTGKIACIYGITMAIFSVIADQLRKIVPVPFLTFAGLSLLVYSYFLNNELSWLTGYSQVMTILFLRGAGIGLALGPTTFLALYGIPKEFKDAAATLLTFFRQVGLTYGGTLISIVSIRQTIFHAARFSEQTNNQLPAYQMTLQNVQDRVNDLAISKALIVRNLEIQAYVQGLNDSLIFFGYVTGALALLLMGLVGYRSLSEKYFKTL